MNKKHIEMKTPQYIISQKQLQENYTRICGLLKECKVHYVLKTNAAKPILNILNSLGSGFECASQNEFETLLSLGVYPQDIICGAVIKTEKMISNLYKQGCNYFVFDDYEEWYKLKAFAPDAKRILRIDVGKYVLDSISWGMNQEQMYKDVLIENKDDLDGVTFHISDNTNIDVLMKVLHYVEQFLITLELPRKRQFILNIGGSYSLEDINQFYSKLAVELKRLKKIYNLVLLAEPGLAVVNTACRYYTKVLRVRNSKKGCTDVYIDGGYPNGITRVPRKINIMNRNVEKGKFVYQFYDLTSIHIPLFLTRVVGQIKEGDILEFTEYGAYTYVYRNAFHMYDDPLVSIQESFPTSVFEREQI